MARPKHMNSFTGDVFHARRLFGQDVDMAALTPAQRKAVAAEKQAWVKANSAKGIRAIRLKQVKRLRAKADALEAELRNGAQ